MTETPTSLPGRFRPLISLTLAVYWVGLFISTHIPAEKLPSLPGNSDKLAHGFTYAGLTCLLGLWFWSKQPLTIRRGLTIFAIVLCYAVFDELTQIPVGRTADVYDALADTAGSGLGLVVLFASSWLLSRRTQRND